MSNISVTNWLRNASFEEQSVWIQLAGLAISFGGYLFVASRLLASGVTMVQPFAAVWGVSVALLVVILVVGHIVAAVASRPDGSDERDRLIGWRAAARADWLLATGVIVAVGCMAVGVPNVWTANLLLMSLYLAEMLGLALQALDYRRGF